MVRTSWPAGRYRVFAAYDRSGAQEVFEELFRWIAEPEGQEKTAPVAGRRIVEGWSGAVPPARP